MPPRLFYRRLFFAAYMRAAHSISTHVAINEARPREEPERIGGPVSARWRRLGMGGGRGREEKPERVRGTTKVAEGAR